MGSDEEWAIWDETTGKWFSLKRDDGLYRTVWVDASSATPRYPKYVDAAGMLIRWDCPDTARIVPAPPREMTDEEARYWFLEKKTSRLVIREWRGASGWCVTNEPDEDQSGGCYVHEYGATIEDAIRAAARKLGAK